MMSTSSPNATSHPKPPPTIIYGTGFLGTPSTFPDPAAVSNLLTTLQKLRITHIDTARRYPAPHPGLAETLLGAANIARLNFKIDTKITPTPNGLTTAPAGSLTPDYMATSLSESCTALALPPGTAINILYPHLPDPTTPISTTAAAFHTLHQSGRYRKLGLSNYPPAQIDEWMSLCDEHGYVRPSVYQGQYNALCRRAEEDHESGLFATVRKHGMAFHAYSPLAGGVLTGKLTAGDTAGTRFARGEKMAAVGRAWYDKPAIHDAVRALQGVLKEEGGGVEMTGVCLRWLMWHSRLQEGDAVILGGGKVEVLEQNVGDLEAGPLGGRVLAAVERMWLAVRDVAP